MNHGNGNSQSPKGSNKLHHQPSPYENIHVMIKYSKGIHAANAGKSRGMINIKLANTF